MELFLNLVWLFLSAGLVTWWYRRLRGRAAGGWTAVVALGLLLILLLPAISMTDDLQAINMPAEAEHGLRHAMALLPASSMMMLHAVPLPASTPGEGVSGVAATRMEPRTFAAVVRAGAVRAVGTRPPTGLAS